MTKRELTLPNSNHSNDARVLVLGSLNTDRTLRVAHLPLPGETILSRQMTLSCGGKGRNQAAAVAAIGGRGRLIGAVGNDAEGSRLRADLRAMGVDDSLVTITENAATGTALIVVDEAGENSIVVHPGANAMLEPVAGSVFERDEASILLASLEVPLAVVVAALGEARSHGMLSVVNSSPMPDVTDSEFQAIVENTDILIVNRGEARALVGDDHADDAALIEGLRVWHAATGVRAVMTFGADGAVSFDEEGEHSLAAPSVQAVNTVGAGDAFAATLCVALAMNLSLHEAAAFACAAGAIAVSDPESLSRSRLLELVRVTYNTTVEMEPRR